MTETETHEAEPLLGEPTGPTADEHPGVQPTAQPRGEERIEHTKNPIVQAVESVVEKVGHALSSLTGRK